MILKLDLHVHSDRSPDGRSSLDALVKAAKNRGLDGFALADHDLLSRSEVREGILILPACECSTADGHILALCITGLPRVLYSQTGKLPTALEAIEEIHKLGGIAVWAHPFEGRKAVDPAAAAQADAIEVFNARAAFKNPAANREAEALAAQLAMPQTAGSDAHHASEVGNAFTELDCKDKSLVSIQTALQTGNYRLVPVRETPRYKKGLSQLAKCRKNQVSIKRWIKGFAYLFYCFALDLKYNLKRK